MSERYIVRTPFATSREFAEKFRRHFRDGGVFIPAHELPAVGDPFVLEVRLAGGDVAFGADVETAWIREAKPRGVGFRIVRVTNDSGAVFDGAARADAEIIQLAEIAKAVYEKREVSAAWTAERLAIVDRALDEFVK
ncbi:MAG: hypothetical protein HYY84_13615 [Deltaproteobacteria bacterium]|nr:hypothetical protein [Deltaproteobacteria bacterium]